MTSQDLLNDLLKSIAKLTPRDLASAKRILSEAESDLSYQDLLKRFPSFISNVLTKSLETLKKIKEDCGNEFKKKPNEVTAQEYINKILELMPDDFSLVNYHVSASLLILQDMMQEMANKKYSGSIMLDPFYEAIVQKRQASLGITKQANVISNKADEEIKRIKDKNDYHKLIIKKRLENDIKYNLETIQTTSDALLVKRQPVKIKDEKLNTQVKLSKFDEVTALIREIKIKCRREITEVLLTDRDKEDTKEQQIKNEMRRYESFNLFTFFSRLFISKYTKKTVKPNSKSSLKK